ncbi:MAG TPA: carboxypeptidase-like regulatory domain-containing protein [Frankiaceae bacterium]|jgi:hypothetical protein|nr:carboxypeptidase-like regulatory domain-containing protein [Frankiaceae bacterium]
MRSLRALLATAVAATAIAVPAVASPQPPPTYVRGRVLDDAGRPVAGATVRLTSDTDMFGFPILLACATFLFLPQPCRPAVATARTGRDGRYAIQVDDWTPVGRAGQKSLTIFGPGTPSLPGAYTATQVYWARRDLAVPDLRLWNAEPSVEAFGPAVRVRRQPLPAAFGRPQQEAPSVYLLQGASAVWRYADTNDEHWSDARTVEQGVTGVREVAVATFGHGYKATYFSRAVPVAAPPVMPPSRGASCAAYGTDDSLVPLAGCRYTDGALAAEVDNRYATGNYKACQFPSARCAHPGWVRLDLGALKVAQAAVVRGCQPDPNETTGTMPAEVSVDGTVWTPFLATNPWSELDYAPPTPVRYLRVDLRSCLRPATEISLFDLV